MDFVLRLLFSLLLLISLFSGRVSAGGVYNHHHHHQRHRLRPTKLFVFGDSYVDTGNILIPLSSAQQFPYGITFPGKPSGRFSDGRVLTDFAARYVGLKSPIPFTVQNRVGLRRFKETGVNFAFGGTGVFDTSFPFPNMTTQIDFFQQLQHGESLSTKTDNQFSAALVSVSGNDYSLDIITNGPKQGLKPFINTVVNQIIVDLKRIGELGVKKIAVTGLGPLGCLPAFTAPSSFKKCNETINSFVKFHNFLLKKAVKKLNQETKHSSKVFVLDMYGAFMSIIEGEKRYNNGVFKTPLKPCCFGVKSGFDCGSVDGEGKKMFVLCKDPKKAFYWDAVHPTQQGWAAAFSALKAFRNHF
ncbi:GDSL esterase/lipase At5g03610-like isoform X3 [Cucurbita moschata]|uniref:GDSL esterase/lipase At5g03610-like isoform X3 n=1 Tax=Cucurbita moschata TaxID=3662 RepID=A0A6J1EC94_CUCMO|nr:GDSL esterase/lipase At5g03610-like isoform X3 [Cucurbita moschata]